MKRTKTLTLTETEEYPRKEDSYQRGRYTRTWFKAGRWPESAPENWFGVEAALVPEVRKSFFFGFVFERLAPGPRSRASECRIVCYRGEISPVSPGVWSWSGPGGLWSKRVIEAVGTEVTGPFGNPATPGRARDENVLWFPFSDLPHVAAVVRAKRRRSTWEAGTKIPKSDSSTA